MLHSIRTYVLAAIALAVCRLAATDSAAAPVFITNQGFELVTEPGQPSVVGTSFPGGFWTLGVGTGGAAQLAGCCGAGINFSNGDVWSGPPWSNQNSVPQSTVDTPGWTQSNGAFGVEVIAEPGQGSLGAYLNNPGGGSTLLAYSNQLGVGQTGVQIPAGGTFTLSIDAGGINGSNPTGPLVLNLIANSVNAANGATAPGAVTLTGTGLCGFVDGVTVPTTSWATYSVQFSGAQLAPYVGDYVYIGFGAKDGGGGQLNFDNVRLSLVPEPASCVLFGLGAIGLAVAARRRRTA